MIVFIVIWVQHHVAYTIKTVKTNDSFATSAMLCCSSALSLYWADLLMDFCAILVTSWYQDGLSWPQDGTKCRQFEGHVGFLEVLVGLSCWSWLSYLGHLRYLGYVDYLDYLGYLGREN